MTNLVPPNVFNFSIDVIDKWAKTENKAMIWTNVADPKGSRKDLSFKHFSNESHRAAWWLSEQVGARKGDRLIIMLPRVPEWWEIVLGAIRLGVVVIPCTTLLTPKDIEYRLRVSHAKFFVSDEAGAEKFRQIVHSHEVNAEVLVRLRKNSQGEFDRWYDYRQGLDRSTTQARFEGERTDPCMIYFTSGTSGPPKMVSHNQVSYPLGHNITGQHWLRLSPGKTYWNTSELGWAKAAWSTFGCWSMGATLFIQDDPGAFSPERFIRNLHQFDITTLCAPPTAYRQLVVRERLDMIKRYKPRALECCLGAGEALNAEVLRAWKQATGLDIFEGYGQESAKCTPCPKQTETILICGNFEGSPIRPGSMGKASPGIYVGVVDYTGKELAPGEEGDIAVLLAASHTSPPVPWIFDGYLKEDGSVLRPEVVEPGTGRRWYLTGDRATRDKDGYFWFVGRADDVINTSGYRVGPFEIESVLKEHEGVVESAVVASPDPERGEIIKAFIVLTDEYRRREQTQLASEIQDFVARTTAPYKKPREVEFVDALQKTISGKIRRVDLRAQERVKKANMLVSRARL